MTREEAKEVFLNRGFINGICDGNKWRDACIVISEWLKEEPRWIPVSERLPEEYELVLCWYEYFRYGDYNCMYKTYGVGFYGDGYWGGDVTGHKVKVFAWMPLPKPYDSQEREDNNE